MAANKMCSSQQFTILVFETPYDAALRSSKNCQLWGAVLNSAHSVSFTHQEGYKDSRGLCVIV